MNILFIDQNFPDQSKFDAPALVQQGNPRLTAPVFGGGRSFYACGVVIPSARIAYSKALKAALPVATEGLTIG